MKKQLSSLMEWIRPAGIGLAIYFAYASGDDPVVRFHILGPWIALLMCGTVAFEALVIGPAGSGKIGYTPNRAYQVQSGLANLAIAVTAALLLVLDWGVKADATITTAMLAFFAFSGLNHLATAVLLRNFKPVNLLRPVLAAVLISYLVPIMIQALKA